MSKFDKLEWSPDDVALDGELAAEWADMAFALLDAEDWDELDAHCLSGISSQDAKTRRFAMAWVSGMMSVS